MHGGSILQVIEKANRMNVIFFLVCFYTAVIMNGLWYYIKYVVRQHGYETRMFRGLWQDILSLQKLIEREQNTNKKRKYKTLLFSFYVVVPVTYVIFILFFYFELF